MNEVAIRGGGQVDPAEAARLSKSRLMPEHIAGDAASAEYMMRFGAALGIDPMSSFQHIFVFPGKDGKLKAGMSAHLKHALAVAAGHTLSMEGSTATRAVAVLVRRSSSEQINQFRMMREEERRLKTGRLDDVRAVYSLHREMILDRIADLKLLAEMEENPDPAEILDLKKQLADLHGQYDFAGLREGMTSTAFDLTKLLRHESVWTMNRAAAIGLTAKQVWKDYGPEMLVSRAKSTVVNMGAIEVILGVKNILSDMGLLLSTDEHDHLAMASSLYTPEEQGADVNGEGVPLAGQVIDVTQSGSEKQEKIAGAAQTVVDKGTPQQIAEWSSWRMPDWGSDDKISLALAIQRKAVDQGKGDDLVKVGDGPEIPLALHLQGVANSFRD